MRHAAATALAIVIAMPVESVDAQVVKVERSRTWIVGFPAHGYREDRGDASRTGWSPSPLPTLSLKTIWTESRASAICHAPVVDEDGMLYVVDASGGVEAITSDG